MGLHGNWKPLLKELYGSSFLKALPNEAGGPPVGVRDEGNEEEEVERARRQCQVMLVDFLPMLFGKSKAIKTGEHFLNFVFKFIRDFFDSGGDTCVILIDEPALVPLAKAPTQAERDKYAKPLTERELGLDPEGKREVMSDGYLIHQDWHRVMANRALRAAIFRYFEKRFLRDFFEKIKERTWRKWGCVRGKKDRDNPLSLKRIIVDGGQEYPNPYIIGSTGTVTEMPAWKNWIGEADLKIPFYINHIFIKQNVLVHTIDSDLIRILLAGTCLRIDPSTGKPRNHIFLRLNDTKTKVPKDTSVEKEPAAVQQMKRKRGRPKKQVEEGQAEKGASTPAAGKAGKPRGRPAKRKAMEGEKEMGKGKSKKLPKQSEEEKPPLESEPQDNQASSEPVKIAECDGGHGQEVLVIAKPEEVSSAPQPMENDSSEGEPQAQDEAREEKMARGLQQDTEDAKVKEDGEKEKEGDTHQGQGPSEVAREDSEGITEHNADGATEDGVEEIEPEYDILFEKDIVDINHLWEMVIEHWKNVCPDITDPIIHLVLLMTLGGDDFVKNLPNVGAKIMHNVYITNVADIGELVAVHRQTNSRAVRVELNVPALWKLVRYTYAYKLKAHLVGRTELPEYSELEDLSKQKLKRVACHCVSADAVEATFRRVRWTLLYVLNGGNSDFPVPDCMEKDNNGLSLHGWELNEDEGGTESPSRKGRASLKKKVARATKISPCTEYTLPPPRPLPETEPARSYLGPVIVVSALAIVGISLIYWTWRKKE